MTDKRELNNEELEEVTGGESFSDYRKEFTNKIDKYETANHIGEDLLIDEGDGLWVMGTILDSYEKSIECGATRRTVTLSLKAGLGGPVGSHLVIGLDRKKLYIR